MDGPGTDWLRPLVSRREGPRRGPGETEGGWGHARGPWWAGCRDLRGRAVPAARTRQAFVLNSISS